MTEKIWRYWEARAAHAKGDQSATTNDVWLRELEIATLASALREFCPSADTLLDAGCGDGYSTVRLAEAFTEMRFEGVDFSPAMIETARTRLASRSDLASRVEFRQGDVKALREVCDGPPYDVVVTDRCLINLAGLDEQIVAVAEIAARLAEGGHYLCIENFVEGHDAMNAARRAMDLPEIPVRWHNVFFREGEFLAATRPYFSVVATRNFASSYYFATRVVYSKLCQLRGEEPDYEHEVHRLAVNLPWTGDFSPVRLLVLRRVAA